MHKIAFSLLAEDRTTQTNGFLSITRCTRGRFRGKYRAQIRIKGEKKRLWGSYEREAQHSVKDLLPRLLGRLAPLEKIRVLNIAEEVSAREELQFVPPPVAIVHQIYGLFRDGKSMPMLFQNSQHRWMQVAKNMNVVYHLWCADEIEALIKQNFLSSGTCMQVSHSQ